MPEYYPDVESAAGAAVERVVPRSYSLLKMEEEDTMALIEGDEEQVYDYHVKLFNPEERVIYRVDTTHTEEGWTAEVL
ncbi:hypothetical protein OB920_13265 [Halobacteria archaeon HArc-gm2]|nr:hypothetical protein [Halobacteria archaeon HArc-gm2]